jgi:hypothetical protein
MWYILHKKEDKELNKNNIVKIVRYRELDLNFTFNGYCMSHKIPEGFEKSIGEEEKDINVTLNVINEETVKLAIWEWDVILTFKSTNSYHNELSPIEEYELCIN